jgi:hypothetical protein
MTSLGTSLKEARLVVPEGWLIDDASRDRVERQLERAPASIVGVAAEAGELESGASYRVHAEWRSLEPLSAVVESGSTSVQGAVLLRPGVEFNVNGGLVEVADGTLLVDLGAHVHDPWRPIETLDAAVAQGRPPFPRRPVIVFLGSARNRDLADWARRLVNRLVRRDLEARLALPELTEGLHLTRPCLPCEGSIVALEPEVIVALDKTAVEQAHEWSGQNRKTIVIEFVPDLSVTIELVPWQIGRASRRVRARIGQRVDASNLGRVVHRVCAGPQPMPPSQDAPPDPRGVVSEYLLQRHSRQRTSAMIVSTGDTGAAARVEGLADQLSAAGVSVSRKALTSKLPRTAQQADLVILVGINESCSIGGLIEARRDSGKRTVLDVSSTDVMLDSNAGDRELSLKTWAADLARRSGLVTSPGGALHTAVKHLGVRAHVLPTLLTRSRTAELVSRYAVRSREVVVGWHVGSARHAPAYFSAVAEAIAKVLADNCDLIVEVVGEPERVPPTLRRHERVRFVPGPVEPAMLRRWIAHLWTPPIVGGEAADEFAAVIEAGCAGVPSVMPASAREAVEGYVSPELFVTRIDEPDEWAAALGILLDERVQAQRSAEALRRSLAVQSPATSRAVVNRFLGWALYERPA